MVRKKGMYAVYKGDRFLVLGTLEECAEFLGVKPKSVTVYHSVTNSGKKHRYQLSVIRVGDVEE
jgi:hypothetical protein